MSPSSTEESAPPPPPPRPPSEDRRLERARDGRVIAGVAAGLAAHLRVDVTLVRIAFVLGAVLLEGLGLLAYGLLWLLVPEAPATGDDAGAPATAGGASSRGRVGGRGGREHGPGFWVGVALVAVGALWLLPSGGFWGRPLGPGWLLPLLLIGVGAALWVSDDRESGHDGTGSSPAGDPGATARPAATSAQTEGGAPGTGTSAWAPTTSRGPSETGEAPSERAAAADAPTAGVETGGASPPPGGSPPGSPSAAEPAPAAVPPPPRRERSGLVRATLGLALVAVGALWLLGQADVADVGVTDLAAVALLVLALGLLVGSWWGRARPLVLVGLLLAPVAALGLVRVEIPWSGTVGDRTEVPTSAAGVQDEYVHAAGRFTLDLTQLEDLDEVATSVEVGAGEVVVVVPEDARLDLDASAGVGELHAFDWRRAGVGPQLQRTRDGQGEGVVDLEVRLGAGQLTVRSPAWSAPDPPVGEAPATPGPPSAPDPPLQEPALPGGPPESDRPDVEPPSEGDPPADDAPAALDQPRRALQETAS